MYDQLKETPQEIIDQIMEYLPPDDILTLREKGILVRDDVLKHAQIYASVFKTMDWLEAAVSAGASPVLVGHGLRNLPTDSEEAGGEIHIFFLSMDFPGDSLCVSPRIRDCLQDHDLDSKHNAHIHGTNIIVHICEDADICFALVGARDHTVYQSLDQLVSDGVTAILPYIGPSRVQVFPVQNLSSSQVRIRFEFEKYTLTHPNHPSHILEWVFTPEYEGRQGEEDHERYVGPEGDRLGATEIARREL